MTFKETTVKLDLSGGVTATGPPKWGKTWLIKILMAMAAKDTPVLISDYFGIWNSSKAKIFRLDKKGVAHDAAQAMADGYDAIIRFKPKCDLCGVLSDAVYLSRNHVQRRVVGLDELGMSMDASNSERVDWLQFFRMLRYRPPHSGDGSDNAPYSPFSTFQRLVDVNPAFTVSSMLAFGRPREVRDRSVARSQYRIPEEVMDKLKPGQFYVPDYETIISIPDVNTRFTVNHGA